MKVLRQRIKNNISPAVAMEVCRGRRSGVMETDIWHGTSAAISHQFAGYQLQNDIRVLVTNYNN